ncbi:hypothetical protein [Mesorhizobium sp. B2-8-5]|uniref:hypothetical protein n=1 Tax=Mesorhizobium sp. B2-8-5 TaxID=2589903 RepID=UPI0011284FE5|nr:hypothetical protein [Mesorhizobium sp. B2-8-5]UCI23716.1 hypothetical protein FJ430_19060 [Mesorhizobium sp. B2-8-5]
MNERKFYNPESHFAAPPPPPPEDRVFSMLSSGMRHVDLPTGYTLAPADAGTVIRCSNFPECMCGEDCIDRPAESPIARRILIGLMIAVAAIGLLYAELR